MLFRSKGLQRLHNPTVVRDLLRCLNERFDRDGDDRPDRERTDVRVAAARALGQYPLRRVFAGPHEALAARELAAKLGRAPCRARAPISAAAQTSAAPTTPWGAPDLQGVWDFRSLTPMDRPRGLGEKEVFTAEEAATFAQDTITRESRDIDESLLHLEVAKGRVVPYWRSCARAPLSAFGTE